MSVRKPKDIAGIFREGRAVDRAVRTAFGKAVHRHRQANVPMAMWEDGKVVLVSPFDVRVPEEEDQPDDGE